jgi:hypothetical protein
MNPEFGWLLRESSKQAGEVDRMKNAPCEKRERRICKKLTRSERGNEEVCHLQVFIDYP